MYLWILLSRKVGLIPIWEQVLVVSEFQCLSMIVLLPWDKWVCPLYIYLHRFINYVKEMNQKETTGGMECSYYLFLFTGRGKSLTDKQHIHKLNLDVLQLLYFVLAALQIFLYIYLYFFVYIFGLLLSCFNKIIIIIIIIIKRAIT